MSDALLTKLDTKLGVLLGTVLRSAARVKQTRFPRWEIRMDPRQPLLVFKREEFIDYFDREFFIKVEENMKDAWVYGLGDCLSTKPEYEIIKKDVEWQLGSDGSDGQCYKMSATVFGRAVSRNGSSFVKAVIRLTTNSTQGYSRYAVIWSVRQLNTQYEYVNGTGSSDG